MTTRTAGCAHYSASTTTGGRRTAGRVGAIGIAVGLLAGAATAQEPVTIVGANVRRTIDCGSGGSVTILGSDHKLTLRGRCESVSVTGTHHLVQIEGLGRLTVTGVDHRVEWEYALKGDQPVVLKTGTGSEVVQVKGGAAARESAPTAGKQRSGGVVVEGDAEGGGHRVTIGPGGISVDPGSGRASRRESGGDKGGAVMVVENALVRTHDCGGGTANILGNDNQLTLRNCVDLIVAGNDNELTLQGGVRLIRLLGHDNRVTWSEGLGGKAPGIETLGSGNKVTRSSR